MNWKRKLNGRNGFGMGIEKHGRSGGFMAADKRREDSSLGVVQSSEPGPGQDQGMGGAGQDPLKQAMVDSSPGTRNHDEGL